MNKEQQINALTNQLLKLLESDNGSEDSLPAPIQDAAFMAQGYNNFDLEDLDTLKVDVPRVRKIMKRVDEVYGKPNPMISAPLFNVLPDDK